MSVSHNILGSVSKVLPHVGDQLIDLLHGERDVVLVGESIMGEGLGHPFPQRPESLNPSQSQRNHQCSWLNEN